MRDSLWLDTRPPARPPLDHAVTSDVAIIGAGITGLTAAVELARAGCRVVVLEHRRLGSGATGFTTAKVSLLQGARYQHLRRHHGDEVVQHYADSNIAAADWLSSRVVNDGIECGFEHRSALSWAHGPAGAAELEAEAEALARVGFEPAPSPSVDLPFPVAGAIELTNQAQLDPMAYLTGLAHLAEAAGAMVHEHTRALGVDRDTGRLRVLTSTGELNADHVLVCTGTPFLDRGLFFARLEPVRSYLVAVAAPDSAPRSMSISVDDPVRSMRTASAPDGQPLLLVGGESHVVGRRADTDEAQRTLVGWAGENLGAGDAIAGWSTQDYTSTDGLPYVGSTRTLPDRVLVATGFAKWGMTGGTAAGLQLAGDVLGEPTTWAPAFDAGRLGPARSLPRLARVNAAVGLRLISDRLHRPADNSTLKEGQGRVVRRGLGWVAEACVDGRSCAVSGVCSHLGGILAWNPLERSWDCPLHGSRFDSDGHLLQGPAVRDLAAPSAARQDPSGVAPQGS